MLAQNQQVVVEMRLAGRQIDVGIREAARRKNLNGPI